VSVPHPLSMGSAVGSSNAVATEVLSTGDLSSEPMFDRRTLRERLTSGALSDALDSAGIWSVLPSTVRPIAGGRRKFFGPAFTVSWVPTRKQVDIRAAGPSTWLQVREFLIPAASDVCGMVYVAGALSGSVDRFALAGGLSTGHFERIGMEAVVLYGAVRDAEELANRSIPICATGFSPMDTQGNYKVQSAGDQCMVGDICVHTGDWVFGDDTGIVVLPAASAREIVSRALEILNAEEALQLKLDSGLGLMDVLDQSGHI
jgi:regulator of RNase E activity RraA